MSNSPHSIFERHRIITLVCINSALFVILVCVSELLVRLCCPQIKPFYLSSSLMQKNRFGSSFGMAPNQRGTTGPAEVITDKYGFRTAPDSPAFRATLPTILFLGDSVLFGHNVAAEKTFIEIVKRKLEGSVNIIGASAPGWDIDDYLHVIQYFVLPQHESLNIAAVIIVYCLNDITPLSAFAIQQYLHSQPEQSAIKKPQVIEQLRSRMWAFKKQYNVVQFFNDIFNRHSRLFILVKRHLLDPPHGYYMYESKNYENEYLLERLREKIMLMQKMLNCKIK